MDIWWAFVLIKPAKWPGDLFALRFEALAGLANFLILLATLTTRRRLAPARCGSGLHGKALVGFQTRMLKD